MSWLSDYLDEQRDEAVRQQGRFQGQSEAYKEIKEHLDPAKFCQDCGASYWRGNQEKERAEHEAKCEARKRRLNPSDTTGPDGQPNAS